MKDEQKVGSWNIVGKNVKWKFAKRTVMQLIAKIILVVIIFLYFLIFFYLQI